MRTLVLAVLLLGCGDDQPTCPQAPDGGYQPGDKIVDCADKSGDASPAK